MQFLTHLFSSSARNLSLLAFLSFGLLSVSLAGDDPTPASDLTITVQEQENGDVRFSLSGTAYYKNAMGNPTRTPVDAGEVLPPHSLDDQMYGEIPEGLILTVPDNTPPPPGAVGPPPTREVSVRYLDFNSSGYWSFYSFVTGQLNLDDEMVGSGSVITDAVPFSNFEVGTFEVEGGDFDATYVVLPFSPKVKAPATRNFPKTLVGRSSRTSKIVIRNTGVSTVQRLKARIKGRASRDFRIRKRPASKIEPGKSTTLKVYFRPRKVGKRRAVVTLMSNSRIRKTKLNGRGFVPEEPAPGLNRPG